MRGLKGSHKRGLFMADKLFQKYYKRVAKEGVLKALLIALSIASGALALTAALSWFFGFKAGLYIGIALFVAILGALTPLLYIRKFRPSTKAIAQRVDELGLEERVLTMTELENDSSYLALKQREDTVHALKQVDHMLIKIAVSTALIVVTAAVVVFGAGFMTVDTLYVAGVIPSGVSLISEAVGDKSYIVSYDVDLSNEAIAALKEAEVEIPESGYGFVYYYDEENWRTQDKFEDQIEINEGEAAPAVLAVASRGYVFVRWSDGVTEPYRQDVVTHNIAAYAIFDVIPDLDVEDPQLQDPSSGEQGRGQGDESSENGDTNEGNGDAGEGSGGDDAGGNHNSASNTTTDGQTYYGDEFDDAYSDAQDRLNGDSDLSDEQKDWANGYFESLESGK